MPVTSQKFAELKQQNLESFLKQKLIPQKSVKIADEIRNVRPVCVNNINKNSVNDVFENSLKKEVKTKKHLYRYVY